MLNASGLLLRSSTVIQAVTAVIQAVIAVVQAVKLVCYSDPQLLRPYQQNTLVYNKCFCLFKALILSVLYIGVTVKGKDKP